MSLTFANAAVDHVLEHGPLTVEQLHELGLAAGTTRARGASSLRSALTCDPRFVVRPDGRLDTAARLLRGATFVTRLRRPLTGGVLWVHRDLDPLLALRRDSTLPLTTGGVLAPGKGSASCWVGPPGWADPVAGAALLALTWDGRAATVTGRHDEVAIDSDHVHQVQLLLARHARALPPPRYGGQARPSLTTVVLSALLEEPALLAEPLPPLSQLLPLPEEIRPQDEWCARLEAHGEPLALLLPPRVIVELGRRADLLGERLSDYVAMLLSAAADRLHLAPPRRWHPADEEPCWTHDDTLDDTFPDAGRGQVVDLRDWSR